jgi:hypothetical protein
VLIGNSSLGLISGDAIGLSNIVHDKQPSMFLDPGRGGKRTWILC